jgi:hypothetical protein
MGHPLRWYQPGVVYEVTSRTIQERFLLRPSERSRDLIVGVLCRALVLFPQVFLHAFTYLSNHYHLLCSASDGAQLAAFLGYVNGNVARELGRLHDWTGPFWARRPRVIPILDDDAVIARLRYLLANGVKEGLVTSPREWAGASSTPGLLGDMTVDGVRIRRDLRSPAGAPLEERVALALTPIPPWAHLPPDELRRKHLALVESVEAEAHVSPAGMAAVAAQSPHDRPSAPERSSAPLCHASTPQGRSWFRTIYRAFVDAFCRAAQSLRNQVSTAPTPFPAGSFPRAARYVMPALPDASTTSLRVAVRPIPQGFS